MHYNVCLCVRVVISSTLSEEYIRINLATLHNRLVFGVNKYTHRQSTRIVTAAHTLMKHIYQKCFAHNLFRVCVNVCEWNLSCSSCKR